MVIREPWLSARRTSRNRIRIAKIATPTIRVPFSRSNENAESSASGISVPATTASAERDQQQDQHVGVAQLAPAPDREAADQRGEHQAAGADRGQLGRQDGRLHGLHAGAILYPRRGHADPDPGR